MFPKLFLTLDLPQRPEDLAKRHHNRFVRLAVEGVIRRHYEQRLPKHFEPGAHGKYRYAERNEKYKKEKLEKYGSETDLVKTGRSMKRILNEGKITISGSAEGSKKPIGGKLTVSFNFRGGGGRRYRKQQSPKAVQIEQMHREIQAMTDEERKDIANQFRAEYMVRLREFRAERQRVRLPVT